VTEHQLDLFADVDAVAQPVPGSAEATVRLVSAADMDDAALVAAIPDAGFAYSPLLAAEAGRRRLVEAVPTLTALCRRFAGFGANRIVPEQAAALGALAAIGTHDAGQAVSEMICRAVVQGPTLAVAVAAAAQLNASLPAGILGSLLQHADPAIRATACRCARRDPHVLSLLLALLRDHDPTVALSAACTLGRLGHSGARPKLKALLHDRPSKEVIESVSTIADEECMVLLGHVARRRPDLAVAVLEALESIDHPHAGRIARGLSPSPVGPD
jgi:hypothetical protein